MTYDASWHLEDEYDFFVPQFSLCDDEWQDTGPRFTGFGEETYTTEVPAADHSGSIKLRFLFVSDVAFSDEDGLFDSDGAFILDLLTVSDAAGIVIATEDFNGEATGATSTTNGAWTACNDFGRGNFAGQLTGVFEEDPCRSNVSCQWAFFQGSDYYYACGGFPLQKAVPHQNARGQYIANEIWSPRLELATTESSLLLRFDVYRDLPLDNLVGYLWHVRSWTNDCPGEWRDDATAYFGDARDWFTHTVGLGALLEADVEDIQVALGVRDMCRLWCGVYGTGVCHSHAPLFDNVKILQVDVVGPQWFVRPGDLFQDTFPMDGTTSSTARADIALDVRRSDDPAVTPGDSAAVAVDDISVGLAEDPYSGSGSAVYGYFRVTPTQAGKSGANLTDDSDRYPYTGSVSVSGDLWYRVRMDSVRFADVGFHPLYCVDLNDDLFTPGDVVHFFYGASNANAALTYWTSHLGATDDIALAAENAMEFSFLPTVEDDGDGILFVDDADGTGSQLWFDEAFDLLALDDHVDRFDIRSASSALGNGPATRSSDVWEQLLPYYSTIIWNSGDLSDGLVGDGVSDKSNDYLFLFTFLNNITSSGGLYLTGDNLAGAIAQSLNASAITLKSYYIPYSIASYNHVDYGIPLSPLVTGTANGCFSGPNGPDTFVAYGGCPTVGNFDVLSATGTTTVEAHYGGGPGGAAIISNVKTNSIGTEVGVILSGFGFHRIRDYEPLGVPSHAIHLGRVLSWLGHVVQDPVAVGRSVSQNIILSQNFPNPFNPSTSIRFSVPRNTNVRIAIYDVAGHLIRVLEDEARTAGVIYEAKWDGRGSDGVGLASGIYFCKLEALGQVHTRKLVLLK